MKMRGLNLCIAYILALSFFYSCGVSDHAFKLKNLNNNPNLKFWDKKNWIVSYKSSENIQNIILNKINNSNIIYEKIWQNLEIEELHGTPFPIAIISFHKARKFYHNLGLNINNLSQIANFEQSLLNNFSMIEPSLISYLNTEQNLSNYTYSNTSAFTFPQQNIKLDKAFDLINNKKLTLAKVVVAIIDSGIDYKNTYLKDNIFFNTKDKIDCTDNDNYGSNSYIDDYYGIDASITAQEWNEKVLNCCKNPNSELCTNEKQPIPGSSNIHYKNDFTCLEINNNDYSNCIHGTHVAGLIAAKYIANTNLNMYGACPSCQIISIKATETEVEYYLNESYLKNGGITDASQIRAFTYLLNLKDPNNPNKLAVDIVNLSIGKYYTNRIITNLINYMSTKHNIIFVAAAGNDNTDMPSYPAAYSDIIGVSALSKDKNILSNNDIDSSLGKYSKSSFSNFGSWVKISAPGSDICSVIPGEFGTIDCTQRAKSGTSQASPIVTGVAGLIYSLRNYNSNIKTPADVKNILINTANFASVYNNPASNGGTFKHAYSDKTGAWLLGSGIVDAEQAVNYVINNINNNQAANLSLNIPKQVSEGCVVSSIAKKQNSQSTFINGFILLLLLLIINKIMSRGKI